MEAWAAGAASLPPSRRGSYGPTIPVAITVTVNLVADHLVGLFRGSARQQYFLSIDTIDLQRPMV
jgi:hypothetical protein